MIIPIRCFTCGKVMADKYDYYIEEVSKLVEGKAVGAAAAAAAAASQPKTKKAAEAQAAKDEASKKEAYATRHFDTIRTGDLLDKMGLTRYCCRRHMLSTVDMMDTI